MIVLVNFVDFSDPFIGFPCLWRGHIIMTPGDLFEARFEKVNFVSV